jgi:hypothetical protein
MLKLRLPSTPTSLGGVAVDDLPETLRGGLELALCLLDVDLESWQGRRGAMRLLRPFEEGECLSLS